MKIIDTKHIYQIGMISTLFSLNQNQISERSLLINTVLVSNGLELKTSLNLKNPVDKSSDAGLYAIHMDLLLNQKLVGAYDSLIVLTDEIIMNINNYNHTFGARLDCLEDFEPNFVEYLQHYLRYQKTITPDISEKLATCAEECNETLDIIYKNRIHIQLLLSILKKETHS